MTPASVPAAGFDLATVRAHATARLAELGLPHARIEEWRFANPAAITRRAWPVAADERPEPAVAPSETRAAARRLGEWPRHEVVLAAGRFHASSGPRHGAVLPAGVRIESLAAAAASTPDDVLSRLATVASADTPSTAFVTQNTALFRDGVYVSVPAGVALGDPLHVAHERGSAPDGPGALVADRVLVEVGAGASLVLVEDLRGLEAPGHAEGGDFVNAVTEIALGRGARCTVVRLVERAPGSEYHVGSTWVRAGEGASFHSLTFATGGALVRDDVHVHFAGEGGEASLDGLFVVSGKDLVDHHTMLDHAVPGCTSRELYKGVIAGSGRGVFNGAVVIRPGAQKSDSAQRNPNLLLSADAVIDTKPELQIYADDVKCAHGATVGQLDENALFYLRARGIDAVAARAMLVHAFAREMVDRLPHAGLRAGVDAWIEGRMDRLAREGA
jgi:Fe-S cluster assembly protein SufD